MKQITITRWIYNEKNAELREEILPINENKGTVDIEVIKIERETEKAIKILTKDYELSVISIWIPKTQIKDSNFGLEIVETPKTEYSVFGIYDSAVEATRVMRALKEEGKKAYITYKKNDCIVMAA